MTTETLTTAPLVVSDAIPATSTRMVAATTRALFT
jgi:hypothetical protein